MPKTIIRRERVKEITVHAETEECSNGSPFVNARADDGAISDGLK